MVNNRVILTKDLLLVSLTININPIAIYAIIINKSFINSIYHFLLPCLSIEYIVQCF
jgi:hypothetical protein